MGAKWVELTHEGAKGPVGTLLAADVIEGIQEAEGGGCIVSYRGDGGQSVFDTPYDEVKGALRGEPPAITTHVELGVEAIKGFLGRLREGLSEAELTPEQAVVILEALAPVGIGNIGGLICKCPEWTWVAENGRWEWHEDGDVRCAKPGEWCWACEGLLGLEPE